MRARAALVFAVGLMGCQEYTIEGAWKVDGVPNPPRLTTPVKTDIIRQSVPAKVDVLFVLDSSSSMREEQEKLARNLPVFLDYFKGSGLSWHMAVTTTDTSDDDAGEIRSAAGYRVVTENTPEMERVFENLVRVGTDGSGDETGLLATKMALSKPTTNLMEVNRGINRPDASLHVIVVSDEDDSSASSASPGEVADFLNFTKPNAEIPVTFNSIVGPEGGCNNAETSAGYGARYAAVTDAVGGSFWSICQRDWAPILDALGERATGIKREFFLSELPIPGSIVVDVDDRGQRWRGLDDADTEPPADLCSETEEPYCFRFEYDDRRNSLTFLDYLPTPMAEVRVTYELYAGLQPEPEDE